MSSFAKRTEIIQKIKIILLLAALTLALFSCSNQPKSTEYPMFWTWMENRAGLDKAYVNSYKFLSAALPEVREYVRETVRRMCEMDGISGWDVRKI